MRKNVRAKCGYCCMDVSTLCGSSSSSSLSPPPSSSSSSLSNLQSFVDPVAYQAEELLLVSVKSKCFRNACMFSDCLTLSDTLSWFVLIIVIHGNIFMLCISFSGGKGKAMLGTKIIKKKILIWNWSSETKPNTDNWTLLFLLIVDSRCIQRFHLHIPPI